MITITERAAAEVKRLLEMEHRERWGLRVGVAGGGCSGLSYTLAFDENPKGDDSVFEVGDIKVFVDPKSYLFIGGLTLDYSMDLLNGGFRFINPNASRTCSCGSSFAV